MQMNIHSFMRAYTVSLYLEMPTMMVGCNYFQEILHILLAVID